MLCNTCLAIILIYGSVHGFTFQKGSSQFLGLRQSSLQSKHVLLATTAKQTANAALHPKVASISVGSIGRSISTLAKDMKYSMDLFMRSTLEKKIVVVAYPLTVVLLYLFFTSTFATVQSQKLFCSFTNFVKSFRKKDANVSTLSASLAMGKSEDVATTAFIRNSIDDTRDNMVEESSKMTSNASIAQARREIELKLAAIVETEERLKLMKGVPANQVQQTFVSLQGSGLDTDVDDFVIETDFAGENPTPVRVLVAAEKPKEVIKQQTIMDLSGALLQKPPKVVADATSATMFAIVVGSPLFQPIVNFFHQHVHLIK